MANESGFVTVICAVCKQELEIPRDMISKPVECPACGAEIMALSDDQPTPSQLEAMKSRTIRIEL